MRTNSAARSARAARGAAGAAQSTANAANGKADQALARPVVTVAGVEAHCAPAGRATAASRTTIRRQVEREVRAYRQSR
jgi:hypothetical protein